MIPDDKFSKPSTEEIQNVLDVQVSLADALYATKLHYCSRKLYISIHLFTIISGIRI